MSKVLYLLRGLPGSGKSTMAKTILRAGAFVFHFEADMYFHDSEGNYNFDATKLYEAHKWCKDNVEHVMKWSEQPIVVSNTFTTEKELKPYYELAEKYDYMVVSMVVENRHGGESIHDVPEETLDKMEKRFTLKLK